jgi:hypothetical protein
MREAEDLVAEVAAEYQQGVDDLDAWLAEEQAKQARWAARINA